MAIILLKDKFLVKNNPSEFNTTTATENTTIKESSELVETGSQEKETETETTTVKVETTVQTTTTKKAVTETKVQTQTVAPTIAPSIGNNAPGVINNHNAATINKGWVQYNNKWYYY